MTRFSLIVFDLDGTLIDSRQDIAESANALLVACNAGPLPIADIGRMVGEGAALLVSRVFEAAGRQPPPDALPRFLEIYQGRLLNHTRPYPQIADVLRQLGRSASLAVLTNKPIAATRRLLAELDLAEYFSEEAVLGGDGPLPRKPDPAGLRHLMAQAGVGIERAILVGDSAIDWRTARNAGIDICLARYGFGFEAFPTDELGPGAKVVDHPLQLLGVLY